MDQSANVSGNTIVSAIKDIILRLGLSFDKLRGQTYDRASNMLGPKSGVGMQIKTIQPKALLTHCHGHSMNKSVKDGTQECKILRDTIGTVDEICILIKFSPKRENILGEIQQNVEGNFSDNPEDLHSRHTSLNKLCRTRWIVRAKCYKKIIDNISIFSKCGGKY